jgi:Flp pilus assembly protein TadG
MRTDDGAISTFVVIVSMALIAVTGLVLDGGRLLAARRQAQDIAANAARAGAQALDADELRSGRTVLDPAAGTRAVAAYLAQTSATGTSRIGVDTVTVTVRMRIQMLLPGFAGTRLRTVTATERARAVRAVTVGDS